MDDPKTCECGCGQPTSTARQTETRSGIVKGQPRRFVVGHQARGRPVSDATRAKRGQSLTGTRNPGWKGDRASYGALHTWLRKHCPKAGICDECGQASRTEYALIHGRAYSRNRIDYRELCRKCHMAYDLTGRTYSLPQSAGMGNHNAKLTDDQVRAIRAALAAGELHRVIAERFGVSKSLISNIKLGLSWSHIV